MSEVLLFLLGKLCEQIVEEGIKYIAREAVDTAGRKVIEFVQQFDTDGDGIYDEEIILHSMEYIIPDLDDDYCFVSDGDTVGIGLPAYKIIDGITMGEYIDFNDLYDYPVITGNDDGFLVDMDHDGDNDDVLVPLSDLTGDGYQEYGWILDSDHNGVPDASTDYPYYELGSEEYFEIIGSYSDVGKSFIIMSSDGTMTVYDEAGNITAEDCDNAYSLWVSDNGILDKPINDYTVTEGFLLIGIVVGIFAFARKLFRKRRV